MEGKERVDSDPTSTIQLLFSDRLQQITALREDPSRDFALTRSGILGSGFGVLSNVPVATLISWMLYCRVVSHLSAIYCPRTSFEEALIIKSIEEHHVIKNKRQ